MKIQYLKSLSNRCRVNRALYNGSLFSIYSFINRGFSFVLLLILANYIAPAEYGYLSLFSTVVMVLGYFMALSSEGYMNVIYFDEGKSGVSKSFSCVLTINIVIMTLLCLLVFIDNNHIERILNLDRAIIFCALVISFCSIFNHLILDLLRLRENLLFYGLLSCGAALLNFVLSIYFVEVLFQNWQGRVYAWMVCSILFGGIGLLYFFKSGYFTIHIGEYFRPLLLWSIPLIPHLATQFIRQGCDRYIINYFHTIEDVGIFSFAFNLVNIITMVGYGFNQANSVSIYKVLSNSNLMVYEKYILILSFVRKYSVLYIVLSAFVTLACLLLFPILLPKYSSSMPYFLILSLYGLGVCEYLVFTNFLFYYKRTKQLMYITFGSSILHLLLSLMFTRYSLFITCIIYVLSQFIVVMLVRNRAIALIKNNLKQI